jgi:nitrogen fixation NifU-like protein
MYSQKVFDHFVNPRNVVELKNANVAGRAGSAKCGDIMELYLHIEDGVTKDVRLRRFWCGAGIVTSSMAA